MSWSSTIFRLSKRLWIASTIPATFLILNREVTYDESKSFEKKFSLIPAISKWNSSFLFHSASCKSSPGRNFDFIADAAEIALPAVVSIDVVHREFIFEHKGSGSGFIVDKRGYIITNEHVVAGNKHVTVVLGEGEKLSGTVVAVDPNTDLALIKVKANFELPEIAMGDDTKLRPGQWVAAIGNSLHFPNTVTAGIISNISRSIADIPVVNYNASKVSRSKYIQTDAAINPGSSGGPLINLNGEVIGVNTMGLTGGANGIAFSIPITDVKRFLREFSAGTQNMQSSYSLGLQIITLKDDMASFLHHNGSLDPSVNSGIYVFDTMRNSPAHRAGLQKGDVIILINKVAICSRSDLSNALQQSNGRPVTVTFYRPNRGFLEVDIAPILSS